VGAAHLKNRLRRWVARHAAGALDSGLAPYVLSFRRNDGSIEDIVDGLRVSYARRSAIGERLFFHGAFESGEIAFAASRLRRRRAPVVLDVGANIGWHALNWARAAPAATLFAFEPSPAVARILRDNIAANGYGGRVEVVETAVSNRSGRTEFFECEDTAYSSIKDTRRNPVRRRLEVACTTIDAFLQERGVAPHLIKIDVEGLEHEVISGARQCLSTSDPDLLVEIYRGENSNTDPQATISLLQDLGYQAFVIVNGGLQRFERHRDDQYNYFFCRGEP
jgi:FkbM family methyltransferase